MAADKVSKTTRRDFLRKIEEEVQALWATKHIYEAEPEPGKPKYFLTFPYPYMNGRLHLGHAFSFSKCEFTSRFQRMLGKNVLMPFGFHCTGMPIPACADRLKKELQAFDPENLPAQYKTLKEMNVPEEEIPKFADANYWLKYFPPIAKQDLIDFGAGIDWRRSFITTPVNPYYDAFVQWQFSHLIEKKKIKFGKKHVIYSTLEAQPCSDHERRKGEGVKPQEYTLIKLRVQEPFNEYLRPLEGKKVFLVAATLRPETMYGQTNCFILPTGEYGAFLMRDDEVFICSERSAKNMAYQDLTKENGKYIKLLDVLGANLLGLKLTAPLSKYETVYSLPMFGITMNKGTGVVTSVPSDSPDDYAALTDLQKKPQLREKYNLTEEMVNFNVIPTINIPSIGECPAVILAEQLGIKSQNDKELLAKAKELSYAKGFSEGIMIIGDLAGQKVSVAKPIIKKLLIEAGEGLVYYEPENEVISRSGESCIVALCDQWFLAYDDEEWRSKVSAHISSNFKAYNSVVMKEFEDTVNWLGEWACSRQYGLGSRLAVDPQYVIESLSDSTIYMSYYTIAHWLQGGVIDGSTKGPAGISPEQLTTKVLDYVFWISDSVPEGSDVSPEVLEKMRNEFKYWYPMDLRCSGKDLIRNHLTMSLFNHAAIWDDPSLWPRSFFCNGHILLNEKKMSKGEGNFLTLGDAIEKYGADATRITIADSGDSVDDANFTDSFANTAILKLYTLHEWITDTLEVVSTFRTGEKNFFDLGFENQINIAIEKSRNAYESMLFREALVNSFFELYSKKEEYRIFAGSYHRDLYFRYLNVQLLLLSPIAPHFCEKYWELYQNAIGSERTLIVKEAFPSLSGPINQLIIREFSYIRSILKTARLTAEKAAKKAKKSPKKAIIYISHEYPKDLQNVLQILHDYYSQTPEPNPKEYINLIKKLNLDKAGTQKMMQFSSFAVSEYLERGLEAFELKLPFDEAWLINTITQYALKELDLEEIITENKAEGTENASLREAALPGRPQFYFYDFR
jgi:leucyl-tRNA synthetase